MEVLPWMTHRLFNFGRPISVAIINTSFAPGSAGPAHYETSGHRESFVMVLRVPLGVDALGDMKWEC
jgi:hypothetical protein